MLGLIFAIVVLIFALGAIYAVVECFEGHGGVLCKLTHWAV